MIFGGTLALASICNIQSEAAFGSHDIKGCGYCDMEIRDQHRDWITDQAIRQGLKPARGSSTAGEGSS